MARIAVAGGGTGGHVYPALAMADELTRRGHEVIYYGDAERLEARVVAPRGYTFRPLRSIPFPRGGIMGKIRFAFQLLGAVRAARKMLREDRIDIVLGVGGYISAPPVLATWMSGRKCIVHEANVAPGLANKLGARVASAILLTYEATSKRLPGSAPRHVVGVPVNEKLLAVEHDEAFARYELDPAKPVVMFVGGSLGAAKINELAVACAVMPDRGFQILHLTGRRFYDEVRAQFGDAMPEGVKLVDYEDQMGMAYGASSLVVCRSGATTLAELTATGRASLLIPSPNVTENHQEHNARGLEGVGAAEVLVEQDWSLEHAVATVRELSADQERLAAMAMAAKQNSKLDASARAVDVIERVLQG